MLPSSVHRLLRLLPSLLALLLPALLRAGVVINEIMYHPASEAVAEEYIELHNPDANSVNLEGWRFTSGVAFTFPRVTLPAGGYLVVAADGAAFAAKYPAVKNVVAGWTGRLSNSASTLVLRDERGVKVDEVTYADDGDWAVRERDDPSGGHRGWRWRSPADGYGKSLELINAAFDNRYGQNWGASTAAEGTPGTANSIAAGDIAPVVTEVRHSPLVPTPAQAVAVNATVLDDHAAGVTVTVHYRRDGAATWNVAPMLDDGAHGDGLAGDKIFGAQLPPEADDTVVEFYVTATDGRLTRTWPAPARNNATPGAPFVAEQSQNCLYQVEGNSTVGATPLYRLVLKAADRAALASINAGADSTSHARFNTTFITMDGTGAELRYLTGVRNRGHHSAGLQPQSFKVEIPNDRPWHGRTALNLNAQYSYLQFLGSAFLRRAGLTAPESRLVRMRVNNVDPTLGRPTAPSHGFYACNEYQDSDFAARHFPTDGSGNIYSVRRTDTLPYQEGDFTHLPPAGRNGGDPYRPVYTKNTNVSEDNWSDLIALTQALAKGRFTTLLAPPTWEADYVAAVQARVDVEQWMTWFAAQALIGNGESNLSNGYGDDYYLYLGVTDPRARLIPYDLDSVLGDGDNPAYAADDLFDFIRHNSSQYAALTPTPLYPLLRHPTFGPLYFAKLQHLLSGPLSIASYNALVDQLLAGVVDETIVAARKDWYAQRHAYVSGRVNLNLGVISGPAVDAPTGYPLSRAATCTLVGRADPARTQSVKVNGVAASYVPWRVTATDAASNTCTIAVGEWTLAGVALQPGINRLLIQAFDGTATEIERTHYEVWYDDGSVATAAGTITGNTTWTAAGGPYLVNAPLTINPGATLTIEPGTTVYLGAGVGLTVAAGGRILAEGTETKPIHFTRAPGSTAYGGTITIQGTAGAPETHFSHVFFNFGGDPAMACEANSNVVLESCEWLRNTVQYLQLNGGSFVVSHCIFPTAAPNARFESINGWGATPPGGRAIIRGCFFGKVNGYNDVIDFTGGNRPGPLLQLYDNVFIGSDDDVLDLDDTDAWIEGNLFMHVHRVGTPDSASAVSGGSDAGLSSEITVVGNLFIDVDQAASAKEGNFFTFLNNTVVDQNSRGSRDRQEDIINQPEVFLPAVLNLGDAGRAGARGLYVEGNLIHSAEKLIRNYTGAELVTLNHNLLPPDLAWTGPGTGNLSAPALLNDVMLDPATGVSNLPTPTKDNYRQVAAQIRRQLGLEARSPARGTGPHGADRGGVRPVGVSLGGLPAGTTSATTAMITVGPWVTAPAVPAGAAQFPLGSGWTHYKWRLDGGAWSAETPAATPLTLTGLAPGPHTLEVVGKNDAGTYQDSPDLGATARVTTATWRVDPGFVPPAPDPAIRLNEVLASNTATENFGAVFPDLIELTNVGGTPVDLGGWGLTDNAAVPYKYTFPAGTVLAPGAFLVVYASGNGAVPAPKTGFGLSASGDDLTLTRSAAAGGGTADRVAWGQQLADLSIGRLADGSWALCRPTFGAANVPAAQSPASLVRINEWLADSNAPSLGDFIELHNPGRLPVDLGGCFLTDNPAGWRNRSPIPPLTFIAAGGYLAFKADSDPTQGPEHVDFRLSPLQGEIGLFSPALILIDAVIYGPQRTNVAQGRAQDSASRIISMLPTAGAANPPRYADSDGDGMPDAWELAHGLDPNNPTDAFLDPDADGQPNLAEYFAGTDPHNPGSAGKTNPGRPSPSGRLINLSVLAPLTEGEVMTLGAAIGGAGTSGGSVILVRAAGPALTQFGVGGALPDPQLTIINPANGAIVASNNDWGGSAALSAAFAQVGAFPYATAQSKDAGLAQPTLTPANYTVQVGDAGAGTGTVIAELYDTTPANAFTATTPRLVNVSVLKRISAGTTLTAGFVIDGPAGRTILLRAVGPTLGLPPFNLPGVMADPKLELFNNATGERIHENNDWAGTAALSAAFTAVAAFPLASASTRDAALLVTIGPGQYSAQVGSADGGEGHVLVEVYEVP